MNIMPKKCTLIFAGLVMSFNSTAGPQLISTEPDRPGIILVMVDWGKMISDPQRGTFWLPCANGNCEQLNIGLIATINGQDEYIPPITSRLNSTTATEADALRLLVAGNRKSGIWRYRIPVPVTSDLCFKYTLGNNFDAHQFHEPACIAKELLTPDKPQS